MERSEVEAPRHRNGLLEAIEIDADNQELVKNLEDSSRRLIRGGSDPLTPFRQKLRRTKSVTTALLVVGLLVTGEIIIMHVSGIGY